MRTACLFRLVCEHTCDDPLFAVGCPSRLGAGTPAMTCCLLHAALPPRVPTRRRRPAVSLSLRVCLNQLCRNVKATQEPRFAPGRRRPRSRSRSRLEPSRRQRRSRSPHADAPPNRQEGHARDASGRVKQNRPEVFQSGTGSRGGVCAVCLGRHEHFFSKCEMPKLWDGSAPAARKNEQGRFAAASGQRLCFDWQLPRGCTSTAHSDRHRCSGCGSADHGAQNCPQAEKA